MYTDDTPAGSTSAVLSASPAIGSFLAGALVTPSNGEVVTVSGASVTVSEDGDTIASSKSVIATFQCTQPGITRFTISHGGIVSPLSVSLVCGDVYGSQFPYYPYNPGYPTSGYPSGYPGSLPIYPAYNTAAAVTVSASPASTVCTSPSSISVTVKDATGNIAPDGTSVTVSASTGTVSPNVVSTAGGYATTTFAAPANSNGTATVTASSGTGTGYATVAFTCTTAAAAPVSPASPVYPPAVAYPIGPSIITPPNTGDAGLVQRIES